MSRPNIILCQCDQLRAHAVGCYGDPVARTPNMDRLAREGVRFATALSNNPVCTPARSCLLSGQYSRTCTAWSERGREPAEPAPGAPSRRDSCRDCPECRLPHGAHREVAPGSAAAARRLRLGGLSRLRSQVLRPDLLR